MAVHVDLSPRGLWCFDVRCTLQARLTIAVPGQSSLDYCLSCALSRLGVHKTRSEEIKWTDSAKDWVTGQGERVIT